MGETEKQGALIAFDILANQGLVTDLQYIHNRGIQWDFHTIHKATIVNYLVDILF